jgi:hypothetical protein
MFRGVQKQEALRRRRALWRPDETSRHPFPYNVSDMSMDYVARAEMPTADHAKALLREVAARYASIISYSDSGAVHTQLNDHDPVFTTIFSTLYKRPSHYRFEFERPHPYPPLRSIITRHGVVLDGSTAYTWKQSDPDAPQMEVAESFSLAIAGATGISAGSAHRIGRLLIPEIGGLSIMNLVDLRHEADTVIDGTPCHLIGARYPKSAAVDVEFAIEKAVLLIRRIKTSRRAGQFSAIELRHSIRVNEPIDDTMFKRAA